MAREVERGERALFRGHIEMVHFFLALGYEDSLLGEDFGALLVALKKVKSLVFDRFGERADVNEAFHLEFVIAHH